jgi:leucyl-tRNA synthetase
MRFSRQHIGENFPVYYVNGLPQMIDTTFANHFTEVENISTEDGLPPLGNALVWAWDTQNKVVQWKMHNHFSS